jgi:hypothetical protein
MTKPQFHELTERLLRAGVAPSHVQRYVRELRDHYTDLYQAEQARGMPPAAADQAARSKLGSDDALVESVLAQPALRSISSRYPALMYGVAPLLGWLVFGTLAVLALQNLAFLYMDALLARVPLARLLRGIEIFAVTLVRLVPLLLSAAVLWSAARRRASARWPITGVVLLISAAASIAVVADEGQVGFMTALLPGFRSRVMGGYSSLNWSALIDSAVRASWMLGLTLAPYCFWSVRRTRLA